MSAGLKQMKDHVTAVKNIKKITQSMKVVAAAKYAKNEKRLRSARPIGMGAVHFYSVSKFTQELSSPEVEVYAVSSDRGLCGSMHAKVCKFVKNRVKELNRKCSVICLGEKARGILQFEMSSNISLVVNGIGLSAPTFQDASRIVRETFKKDRFVQGDVYYPKYKNMVSFEIDSVPLFSLPILLTSKALLSYESDHDDEVMSYLEFSQAAILYYVLCETHLVELSARIMAMSSASKNAGTMADKLQLATNKRRQMAITNELIDIVSGAQVITKK